MTPTLTPLTDQARAAFRERLARTGRAQIDGVLAVTDAQALYDDGQKDHDQDSRSQGGG